MIRHDLVATHEDSLLLIIDFQQAMLNVISSWEKIAREVIRLIEIAQIVHVPVLLTEQYRKGLGGTIPEVIRKIKTPMVFQKEAFSACLEPDFLSTIHGFHRRKIVVVGMETHVCVLQTSLDLINAGFQVHLAADAVASRTTENRDIAVNILRQAGAVISSAETVIFQWAHRSNTDTFRRILPIVK
ncbi:MULTISPECIES: isochorismatase family protein [Desulfococcus]|uniref:Isochorismatase hydrolase n=1 Tax=Desulfococcus multivorans DSM 2059 TaxID=1121405 RepID=S7U1N0_DESML|nr:isochorismatase family protein [Desulfococcus multivorans]AOY58428.1 isochorismatase hydrolase [Desulfococcus multivorans]AQV02942.2 hydrolase [Desulfococcus multivorans]EPR43217.1 isochorismatase hydrolase [Desulfococcus multivorans DSM 2059]MDX9819456.1 isochorismatase family protein [Desulfococcus multivorans]SJZ40439.1 Nicotinamidase-related amidase [Desulfococcus multivorans DSM 2059]